MNDDELDPEIVAALRNVAPASDSLRDQHIANALGEISPAGARSRIKCLGKCCSRGCSCLRRHDAPFDYGPRL